MRQRSTFIILTLLLFVALAVVACSDNAAAPEQTTVEVTRIVEVPAECPDVEEPVCPEVEAPTCPECPEASAIDNVPFEEAWLSSPHADASAEAFVHWNEDDPAEVPENCAKCHSTPGFLDYLGADGSEFRVVNAPAPIGTTVECAACHNEVTAELDSVVFPSGVEITGLGPEARCMECHQGRASTVQVNAALEEAGIGPDQEDVVSEDVGFTNIHYYAAAATQYGTLAMGGYEYEGKSYDARYEHVEGYNTCNSCHDPHTLEIELAECQVCHEDVEAVEDFQNVRMPGSLVDYDGDGDLEEGIAFEIDGLREILYSAMQTYSTDVAGTMIVYDAASYPYFFADPDGDGELGEEPERFASWTPRLAKAAYNYQVSLKDPGRFAHGGKYIIQLLYDSIESLNENLGTVEMSALRRIDHGHFAGSEEAFRHWDEDGMVPGSCSRCHSSEGLPLFITEGVSISQEPSNGLQCATCHNDLQEFTIYEVEAVPFPSGAVLGFDDIPSNLCINCHQGRESTVSVNNAIEGLEPDAVAEGLRFRNIHYFAAGATVFGDLAQGAYQYEGQEYVGQFEHVPGFDSCSECHFAHQLEVVVEDCGDCHEGVETAEDLQNIRVEQDTPIDYDGDGDVTEGIANEVATMREVLLPAIQEYAANVAGTPIVYNSGRYPYWFADTDGNGEVNGEEGGYASWTPRLLQAAYNYQYAAKDTGAYAHNGQYIMQILYDSINSIGGDVSGMTRPPTPAPES